MAIAKGTYVSFCNQSKAHFGLSWVLPWDNRRKSQTHHSMYPSVFNRFPVFQPVKILKFVKFSRYDYGYLLHLYYRVRQNKVVQ